jgi:microsomal dipeptidase-like Zn-dependent dipeptidase
MKSISKIRGLVTALVCALVSFSAQGACLELTCPRDIVITVSSASSRPVSYQPRAINTCDRTPVEVQCTPPSGSLFPIGETVVQCSASFGRETVRCQFKVVVRDLTPPVITTPNSMEVPCTGYDLLHGGSGALVPFVVKATDNSGLTPTVVCTPASGSWMTVGTNVVKCVATDKSGNSATNQFSIVVVPGPHCKVRLPPSESSPDNWSFELGLESWTPSGGAFEFQPVTGGSIRLHRVEQLKNQMEKQIGGDYWRNLSYRVGAKGQHWIGTSENFSIPPGPLFEPEDSNDALKGTLTSKAFVISNRFIHFLVGGGQDSERLRVELLVESAPSANGAERFGNVWYALEQFVTGHGKELMRRVSWNADVPTHRLLGKRARIRIVDQSETGHLNVDDFQFNDRALLAQTVTVGGQERPGVVLLEGHYYDWDSPVWGMADLHTHPMSHLGFAEKIMFGAPDGGALTPNDIGKALGDCNCAHGGWDPFNNPCGDYLRQAVMMAMDDKGNDPHREGWSSDRINGNEYARFRHWPVFSTITHQQMWHEWIRRAYDGGLRVMVALCVNNPLLGAASKGEGPIDDMNVATNQIKAIKSFVARHDDFLEIALDPFELRDIVRRNKLAIILGSELDDIGNLALHRRVVDEENPTAADKEKVRVALTQFHSMGLRYIFPVHLMDNKWGGTPVSNPMLNIANKFLNGRALEVEPATAADRIDFWLPPRMDLLEEMDKHKVEIGVGALLLPAVAGLLPAIAEAWGGLPPGAGAGLLPLAMVGAAGLTSELPENLKAVPPDLWPVGNNYPTYPDKSPGKAPFGHRNARGLTKLGRYAIQQMMSMGVMIDVDHMSQHTINSVFAMAEANPVGYPVNSGHNSLRYQAKEGANENHRTSAQMKRIRKLGGLFGVGYENADLYNASRASVRTYTSSEVDNDCAGTSKTVSQLYLQALEEMEGSHVAMGTDINGLIAGPGPRFGPNSAFARKSPWDLRDLIRGQRNGVRYTPEHGRPIAGPAFLGHGVDPDQEFGWGSPEALDSNQNLKPGYTYSKDQRDFFAALKTFFYYKGKVEQGLPQILVELELVKVRDALSDGYNRDRVYHYALGLIKGIKGWTLHNNGNGGFDERATREWLGRRVFQKEVLKSTTADPRDDLHTLRLSSLRGIWNDYHHVFGKNVPLTRCKTVVDGKEFKDWDINFEGVAHYGLLPDLFQDMTNVGMEYYDLSPLFQSAEDFAGMWVRTLEASDAFNRPRLQIDQGYLFGNPLAAVTWYGLEEDRLEESSSLSESPAWKPSVSHAEWKEGWRRALVSLSEGAGRKFYRVVRSAPTGSRQ